jgi:hypothetical protein
LPFLRFARDKRGYETTSLVHAFRSRQGRVRQKVLYWFRTPPNVKVGRPALDQEAIRWIEEHNPDIEFDWPKILEATPPPAASDDARGHRPRRGRSDRPERGERPERRGPHRAAPAPVDVSAATGSDPGFSEISTDSPKNQGQIPFTPLEEEALEQITHPDAEERPPETVSAVESVLGREQLIRFRARYAELQARIIERGGEPARVEEMRAQTEALNPDSWVTVEEARKGLEEFEPKIRELRAALGLRRRRRSRRGGRGRRGGQSIHPEAGGSLVAGQTPTADPSSNSADAGAVEVGDEAESEDDGGDAT